MMKKTVVILIVLAVGTFNLGLGYWIGVVSYSTREKFDAINAEMNALAISGTSGSTFEKPEEAMEKTKEDFEIFFDKFMTDSLFQIGRIKFPLTSIHKDFEEVVTTSLERADWRMERFYTDREYRPQLYDNFNGKLRDTDERLFCWEGVGTGIYVKYQFKRLEGLWYLVEYSDLSD